MSLKNRPRKTMRKLNGRSKGKQCRLPDSGWDLVEDFQPTCSELYVLANHYLDVVWGREFTGAFLKQYGGYSRAFFAHQRLGTIQKVLGKKTFQEAIAFTKEQWERRFAEASEIERNLKPCRHCGSERDYYDYAAPDIPDGYCAECARKGEGQEEEPISKES